MATFSLAQPLDCKPRRAGFGRNLILRSWLNANRPALAMTHEHTDWAHLNRLSQGNSIMLIDLALRAARAGPVVPAIR
jgi:hypothetical protein